MYNLRAVRVPGRLPAILQKCGVEGHRGRSCPRGSQVAGVDRAQQPGPRRTAAHAGHRHAASRGTAAASRADRGNAASGRFLRCRRPGRSWATAGPRHGLHLHRRCRGPQASIIAAAGGLVDRGRHQGLDTGSTFTGDVEGLRRRSSPRPPPWSIVADTRASTRAAPSPAASRTSGVDRRRGRRPGRSWTRFTAGFGEGNGIGKGAKKRSQRCGTHRALPKTGGKRRFVGSASPRRFCEGARPGTAGSTTAAAVPPGQPRHADGPRKKRALGGEKDPPRGVKLQAAPARRGGLRSTLVRRCYPPSPDEKTAARKSTRAVPKS